MRLTFGNGLVLSRTLDQQYRLTDQTTGTIQDIDFTLDAAGNVDAIADWVNTSLIQGFSQDALHRADWFGSARASAESFLRIYFRFIA